MNYLNSTIFAKCTDCSTVSLQSFLIPTLYMQRVYSLLPPANEVWGKVIFLHLFVILFTGGACMVALGVCGCLWGGVCGCSGESAWLLQGGMHGCSGGGDVWLLRGGMHGWGGCGCSGGCMVAPRGLCMVAPGGMHGCLGGMRGCSWGGMHGCSWVGCAWDTTRYGDTINERAVRILLECILVLE